MKICWKGKTLMSKFAIIFSFPLWTIPCLLEESGIVLWNSNPPVSWGFEVSTRYTHIPCVRPIPSPQGTGADRPRDSMVYPTYTLIPCVQSIPCPQGTGGDSPRDPMVSPHTPSFPKSLQSPVPRGLEGPSQGFQGVPHIHPPPGDCPRDPMVSPHTPSFPVSVQSPVPRGLEGPSQGFQGVPHIHPPPQGTVPGIPWCPHIHLPSLSPVNPQSPGDQRDHPRDSMVSPTYTLFPCVQSIP